MSRSRIAELETEVSTLRQRIAELESMRVESSAPTRMLQRVLADQMVLETLPDIVCVLDRAQVVLYLNRSFRHRDKHEVVGRHIGEFVPPDFYPTYNQTFESVWSSGQPADLEFESVSGFWWYARFIPVRERGATSLMLVTCQEITARVLAERALRESESRLRHAIDVVGMGTWMLDWQGDVIVWDDAMRAICGNPERVPTCYAETLELCHPEDRERVDAAVAAARASGCWRDIECRIVRPSGEVRDLIVKGSITTDAEGCVVGCFGAVFDLTERKRRQEQLYQGQKMEAVGQLTAGIAHNFNNVLSIILPNAALCRRGAPPRLASRLADIQHAAERAADMVRQLMLFARRDSSVQKELLDPRATLQRTIKICRTTFGPNIELTLNVSADVPCLLANASQLEQVVLNICINARDALEEARTPNPRIEIRLEPCQIGARIEVRDNGPGMDEATRARVFEPFFTTKQVGRGTGLGLASAYAIVGDHAGRIACESQPGQGACFLIELPAAPGELIEVALAAARPAPLPGPGRIFIVDDGVDASRRPRSLA